MTASEWTNKYRCTRGAAGGWDDPYCVPAMDEADALRKMREQFPDDPSDSFMIEDMAVVLTAVRREYEQVAAVMREKLNRLREMMFVSHPDVFDRHGRWSADLPTFGGPPPVNSRGVWSWDTDRLLVGTCADNLRFVTRSDAQHHTQSE